jgi:uncharacterized protein with GYD domain
MASYFGLGCFTDQGLRAAKDTVKRADAAKDLAAKFGVQMNAIHWTLGAYDIVVECEARDDAAMAAFSMAISSAGNVRFQSLRAFNRDEMTKVLQNLP